MLSLRLGMINFGYSRYPSRDNSFKIETNISKLILYYTEILVSGFNFITLRECGTLR